MKKLSDCPVGNVVHRAHEREAILADLRDYDGESSDEPAPLFTIETELHGVLVTLGEENDSFTIKQGSTRPTKQKKSFNDRTIKFFRLAKQVGLLQPAINLWLFLGTPQACRRSKKWRRLSSWLTRQITLKNRIALAANV